MTTLTDGKLKTGNTLINIICGFIFIYLSLHFVVLFQDAEKKIPLTNAEISESTVDKKLHAFSIKSKENGRTYYIQAETNGSQNDWMQAICFAKAAGQRGDNSQACVIQ